MYTLFSRTRKEFFFFSFSFRIMLSFAERNVIYQQRQSNGLMKVAVHIELFINHIFVTASNRCDNRMLRNSFFLQQKLVLFLFLLSLLVFASFFSLFIKYKIYEIEDKKQYAHFTSHTTQNIKLQIEHRKNFGTSIFQHCRHFESANT